jgi:hypothetical protein
MELETDKEQRTKNAGKNSCGFPRGGAQAKRRLIRLSEKSETTPVRNGAVCLRPKGCSGFFVGGVGWQQFRKINRPMR